MIIVATIAILTQLAMIGFFVHDTWTHRQRYIDDPIPSIAGAAVGAVCFGCSLAVAVFALLWALA
jgi:hypothetical protein